ncbi:MAG: nucleoside hydrolase [Cytophagia bacterium]|nr:MAG: nucleoside hydrolase [Runella sp.]TAG18323.1 MAG: nucleoside hydrolase [Cytophagales bacterium]TAG37819.1 MAG: nucleoside hydrolase [Cytophagia bacterium]TAG68007.1 MAG: nucleoside hydrolase [Runella slithyformis]TAG79076.1 MAG: nucleoside hydrolase [Cytophagales bacterium]
MKKIRPSFALFLLLVLGQQTLFAQKRIWFDTDLMIGLPERAPREVDDAITLMMALQHPDKVQLAGISIITYADYGYDVAQKMLKWYYKGTQPIPVYKGSDKANDLGVENDATRALAAALKKEKLTILAIGPLTNLGTVLKNHPELATQIEEVVVCAGRTAGYSFKPGLEKLIVSDYNFEKDVESFRTVLDAGVKMVMSGFECSVYLFLGKTDYDFLQKGSEGDQWIYSKLRPWSERGKQLFGIDGFIPFDATPLGHITHPQYFKYYRNIPAQINVKLNDATTVTVKSNKAFLDVSNDFEKTSKWRVDYAYKTLPGFEEILIEALKGEALKK